MIITPFAKQLERSGSIDRETSRGRDREYVAIGVETSIVYVNWVGCSDGMSSQVHNARSAA
jgi:hypothetical protein